MVLDMLTDSFFLPWVIFSIGAVFAGKVIKVPIDFGSALVLGFLLTAMLPWLIFAVAIDLITILAIILFGLLIARYMTHASMLGSITLFLIAILVGGFLLQVLTGSSLAFR
ncbi:MAG: hypothetical protein Q8R15_05095 [Candidatus Micrarchaeota archaeon]|nr:hypothetical protein [Candidatus Micrarchaeota archaeon]